VTRRRFPLSMLALIYRDEIDAAMARAVAEEARFSWWPRRA
jgi:hypothetical protein